MRKFLLAVCVFFLARAEAQNIQRPKLVVGIVVDQMRWDYLYRYHDRYGKDGFQRLLREGFSCENTFIPYVPTVTAAGHTCVYTGSVPALHGILGNYWYSRKLKRNIYCTEDSTVEAVGSRSVAGKMSPRNLWSNTITDELRMATNFRNKTIAIALKDRGSILPGGHTANGAYWFDQTTGGFISSNYYMKSLPDWVTRFNDRHLPDSFLNRDWNTLYPAGTYLQSTADEVAYETKIPGEDNTFPHLTHTITTNKYGAFWYTPYGNSYTLEMAKAAVEGERLGRGSQTDFLAVSLSSTDVIGHAFGPNSMEIEDTYLRLDQDLGAFLKYLDAKVGKGQYLFFLTADHAVAHVPAWETEHGIPAGVAKTNSLQKQLNEMVQKTLHVNDVVEAVYNQQVYLNDSVLSASAVDRKAVKRLLIQALMKVPGVANAIDLEDVSTALIPQTLKERLANGYNQQMSGSIQYLLQPQWFEGSTTGTTHSSWNPYDSHIPLLWFGWNVRSGQTNREVYMTDISATLAALLHIQMPNACVGKVIGEVKK